MLGSPALLILRLEDFPPYLQIALTKKISPCDIYIYVYIYIYTYIYIYMYIYIWLGIWRCNDPERHRMLTIMQ